MDTGEEVRVEVETDDLDRDEFVLYQVGPSSPHAARHLRPTIRDRRSRSLGGP